MSVESSKPVFTRAKREELFTHEECEEILVQFLNDKQTKGILNQFKIIPATEQMGFLGEYYHLELFYRVENEEEEQKTRLFVKSVIYQNADMNMFMEKQGMIKKEAKLYTNLLSQLKQFSSFVWCAKCYFVRSDLFVMQNIEDMGYISRPLQTDFLKESELKPLFKTLAAMHASSMAYEQQRKVTIGIELREWLNEVSVDPDVVWWTTGLKAVLAVAATHPRVRDDQNALSFIANELPRQLDRVYFMVNSSPLHRNVFCHRDAWGGNVFYHKTKPQLEGCILVDFQLCRYAPPAIDFLLTLYINLSPVERRKMEVESRIYYYECLSRELLRMGLDPAKELSLTDFEKSLEDYALFGATYNCIAATVLRLPNQYLKNLKETRPVEFHKFVNVTRTVEVLQLIRDHSEFAEYMYACVDDLLELTYDKQ